MMTNTQEAFENTLHNICDNLRDDGMDADIGEYVNRIIQTCQAHNDAVIAELEEKRIMQLSAISTASIGYFKDGDDIHKDYDTVALRDVTNLYARYTEQAKTIAELVEALAESSTEFKKLPQSLSYDITHCKRYEKLIAKHKKDTP